MDQTYDYTFVERWVIPGTPEQVYDAMVDFDLYPRWGHPAYVSGHRDGPPRVGSTGTVVAKGGLPYELTLHCTLTRLVPGREVAMSITGDLDGELVWRFRALSGGSVEMVNDWRCTPKWIVLRVLSPVMRPLFLWNHRKCMGMLTSGLARYLASAPRPAPAVVPPRSRQRRPAPRASAAR